MKVNQKIQIQKSTLKGQISFGNINIKNEK